MSIELLTEPVNISTIYDTLILNDLKLDVNEHDSNNDTSYFLLSYQNYDFDLLMNNTFRVSEVDLEMKNTFKVSEEQINIISIANELFSGSRPMIGIQREILSESLLKSSKSKPTLPGRL